MVNTSLAWLVHEFNPKATVTIPSDILLRPFRGRVCL
jgi:hypothetical protein